VAVNKVSFEVPQGEIFGLFEVLSKGGQGGSVSLPGRLFARGKAIQKSGPGGVKIIGLDLV